MTGAASIRELRSLWLVTGLVTVILSSVSSVTFAQACYESSIVSPTPFMGNHGEVFRLADGSLWQIEYEYEYLYEYYPSVVVCPSRGKLVVRSKTLTISQVAPGAVAPPQARRGLPAGSQFIESRIDGEFNGWEGETIFKLQNGQVWQQVRYAYRYVYKYSPKVMIFPVGGGYELQVEGMTERIQVRRLH